MYQLAVRVKITLKLYDISYVYYYNISYIIVKYI